MLSIGKLGAGQHSYYLDKVAEGVIDQPKIESLIAAAPAATAAPSFEQLHYSEDGPLARITLERPERRNALSMQLSEELIAALELSEREGAGDRRRRRDLLRRR